VLLKGSVDYHEKAFDLLSYCDYDYTLAKFHILYPQHVAGTTAEEVRESMSRQELENVVNAAVIDLMGCNEDEKR